MYHIKITNIKIKHNLPRNQEFTKYVLVILEELTLKGGKSTLKMLS